MLNRLLRYAPPWISYSKTVCIGGLDEDRATALFKDQIGSFRVTSQVSKECCVLTLRSPKIWLADFDNRQAFLAELSEVMNRLLSIASENGGKLNLGYQRSAHESGIALDSLAFRDEFRLHFVSQQEQKRFMNEARWILPLLTARFGRNMVDEGELGSQNSYRYSRGLARPAIGWASTEPVHLARVRTLLDAEYGEGGLLSLELYPVYDDSGMPEVVLNCIDAPFFMRSLADALLVILAVACRNSRRAKNQTQSERVNSFELQNRFRKASSEGLSARTASSTKSFRVQLLELISSMRKEFLAIDASKDELGSLCAGLAMRALQPGKPIPNTDTEYIRLHAKQNGLSLIEAMEALILSREFINHKSGVTLRSIDPSAYASVCTDISNWIHSETFELFREARVGADNQSGSAVPERATHPKVDAKSGMQRKSSPQQRDTSGVQRHSGTSKSEGVNTAQKEFARFIEQLNFLGDGLDHASLPALLRKHRAMESVFGVELARISKEEQGVANRFEGALQRLGLQDYRTRINQENSGCPYLNGALEQLESRGVSLLVLDMGPLEPRKLSVVQKQFCQEHLSGILCFPMKRYRRKVNFHQELLLIKA